MKKTLLLVTALFCGWLYLGATKIKKPIQPTDVYRIPTLGSPQLSPDGKWVAYDRFGS